MGAGDRPAKAAAPLDALKGLAAANATALEQALGITIIAGVGDNKFVQAVQTINAAVTADGLTLSAAQLTAIRSMRRLCHGS